MPLVIDELSSNAAFFFGAGFGRVVFTIRCLRLGISLVLTIVERVLLPSPVAMDEGDSVV